MMLFPACVETANHHHCWVLAQKGMLHANWFTDADEINSLGFGNENSNASRASAQSELGAVN